MINQPTPSTLTSHGIIQVDGVYQFSEEKKQERYQHSAKGSGYRLDEDERLSFAKRRASEHKELEEKRQDSKKTKPQRRPATAPNIVGLG